jgi:hypothetical protein
MAYNVANPPRLMVPAMNATGPQIWSYTSTDDDATTNGASYYSDGVSLGMRVGDIVLVTDTTTPKVSLHGVASVTATAATTAFGAVA